MDAPNLDALTRDALDYYLFPLATKQDIRSDGPMIFSSAEGMEITDAADKSYLDMMSTQTRASSLGYGQERIARAIYDRHLRQRRRRDDPALGQDRRARARLP